jgi:hypothetical protein
MMMTSKPIMNRCRNMSKDRWKRRYFKYSDEQRIGSMADYLIGEMKTADIAAKWSVNHTSLMYWVWQMRDHFKTRWPRRGVRENDWQGYEKRLDRPTIENRKRYLEAA